MSFLISKAYSYPYSVHESLQRVMRTTRFLSPPYSPYPFHPPMRHLYRCVNKCESYLPLFNTFQRCVFKHTCESYLPSASPNHVSHSNPPTHSLNRLRYCGPRYTGHIPFSPCVHQLLRIHVFNLDRLTYLRKHRIVSECSGYTHPKHLYSAVVAVSAVSPK